MKNRVTFILLLAATVVASAKPVDLQRATRVAQGFWTAAGAKQHATLHPVEWQYNSLYLFTSPQGGWLVLSADDCARPVLAYSLSGHLTHGLATQDDETSRRQDFETSRRQDIRTSQSPGVMKSRSLGISSSQLPAAMQNLMEAYNLEVASVAAMGGAASIEWEQIENGSYNLHPTKDNDEVGPLLSTTWFQMSPYNMLCPSGCMTGCVATAMAQVMRYWNFPAFGIGSHSYYDDTGYGPLNADFGNTRYDWNNMPDRLTAGSSADEKRAVATLMYHCGVAVDMHYGTMESGSTNEKAADAFSRWFRYRPTRHLYKGSMSNDEWTDTLIAELQQGHPILYGGNGPAGGHCFVCDGFNAQRYLHFNMGEDGEADGFYLIGAIGSGIYSFNQSNDAVLGICPQEGPYVNEERLGLTRDGGSATLWVGIGDTTATDYAAAADVEWITISSTVDLLPTSVKEVEVQVTENTTGNARTGHVMFTQNGLTATVEVEQQAYDPTTDYCPLIVVMENTHNEPWADDAHLSLESPSGFVYGTARHTTNTRSSTAVISVAPHDVMVRWHGGGARDRYINYQIINSFDEVVVDVQNAYFDGADVLIEWPCSRLAVDHIEVPTCRVWPNPTMGLVKIDAMGDGPLQATLFDAAGHELLQATSGALDLTGFDAGIYYVRVVTASRVQLTKIIKK